MHYGVVKKPPPERHYCVSQNDQKWGRMITIMTQNKLFLQLNLRILFLPFHALIYFSRYMNLGGGVGWKGVFCLFVLSLKYCAVG